MLYDKAMKSIEDIKKGSPYGFVILSIVIELSFPVIICLDKCRRYPAYLPESCGNLPEDDNDQSTSMATISGEGYPNKAFTVEEHNSSLNTSITTLTEVETYRKYAYTDDNETGSEYANINHSYMASDFSLESRL